MGASSFSSSAPASAYSRRISQYQYKPFLVSSALAFAAFFFAFFAAFFSSSLTGAACYVSANLRGRAWITDEEQSALQRDRVHQKDERRSTCGVMSLGCVRACSRPALTEPRTARMYAGCARSRSSHAMSLFVS